MENPLPLRERVGGAAAGVRGTGRATLPSPGPLRGPPSPARGEGPEWAAHHIPLTHPSLPASELARGRRSDDLLHYRNPASPRSRGPSRIPDFSHTDLTPSGGGNAGKLGVIKNRLDSAVFRCSPERLTVNTRSKVSTDCRHSGGRTRGGTG